MILSISRRGKSIDRKQIRVFQGMGDEGMGPSCLVFTVFPFVVTKIFWNKRQAIVAQYCGWTKCH